MASPIDLDKAALAACNFEAQVGALPARYAITFSVGWRTAAVTAAALYAALAVGIACTYMVSLGPRLAEAMGLAGIFAALGIAGALLVWALAVAAAAVKTRRAKRSIRRALHAQAGGAV